MQAGKAPKSLLKESYIYIGASILSAALPFLLLPILTAYILPEDFGQIGVFQGLYTAFLPLCGLGVGSAIVRRSYDVSADEIGVYIFNSVLILLASTVIWILLTTLFQTRITERLGIPLGFVYLAIFAAAMMFTYNIYLGQLQVNQNAKQFGMMQVSHSAINVGLSLLLIIPLALGVAGRIYAISAAAALFCGTALVGLRVMGRLRAQFNRDDMRGALRFGLPLIPHELGTFFTSWFGVIVLNAMLAPDIVGIYTLAFYAAMAVGLLGDAFNRAYVPWLFGKLKDGAADRKQQIVTMTWRYFAAMGVLSVLAFVLGPTFVSLVFDPSYASAGGYIGWLVLGQAFGNCYLMVTNYIMYSRRTEIISGITVVSSLLNVALLFAIVPVYGAIGAVAAFVCTRITIFVLTFYFANRLVPMPWFARRADG